MCHGEVTVRDVRAGEDWITLMFWLGLWARLFYWGMSGCVKCYWICVNLKQCQQPTEPWKKPWSLYVISVFVCEASFQQRDGWIKGIRGQDWKRLIKAHATISLMNSLNPSAEVKSSFPNPLFFLAASVTSRVICSVYQSAGSQRLHLADTQPANLHLVALWHLL